MHLVNGLVVPKTVEQKTIAEMKGIALQNDDVWVVSYPKSGSTWLQYIVNLIQTGGKDDGRRICNTVPFLESGIDHPMTDSLVKAEDLPSPRAFKSHFPYEMMPCGLPSSTPCKYIYIARNPKDVATSFFYHYRAYFVREIEWKEYIEYFLAGQVSFGNYFDHILSWWAHKGDDNVLFIKFEDMKENPLIIIKQIANFMGYTALTQQLIEEIVEKTSFDKMKDNSAVNYSWSERCEEAPSFMRKGSVGDWKTHFSDEESQRLDEIYHNRFKGNGIDFNFGD